MARAILWCATDISQRLRRLTRLGVPPGLPDARADHAEAVARMALAMQRAVGGYRPRTAEALPLRVGVHSGPVVAGVIGKRKFIYDLWGDTVNTASRMESHGLPDCVQVSEPAYLHLKGRFALEPRGEIEVKGKGRMATYWLRGPLDAAASD